jgi:hypothetical protein
MVTLSEVAFGPGQKFANRLLGTSLSVPDPAGDKDHVTGPVKPVSFVLISIDAPFFMADVAVGVNAIVGDGGGGGAGESFEPPPHPASSTSVQIAKP